MNKLTQLSGLIRRGVKENAPIILSIAGGVGVVATAYLAASASFKAANVIRFNEKDTGPASDRKQRVKERTKLVWKLYIPTGVSAVTSIACIAGANRVGIKKTFAAQAALAVSERAYSEYRDKVIEEFGPRKDQSIRDKVAADRVRDNPPSPTIISGPGNVLCCELFTGRYFTSDMEKLRRAQNDINAKVLKHDYATFDDFYYIVGLNPTTESSRLGWTSDRQMELEFSTTLSEDQRPCITFEYNYFKTL